uniref:CUB domain-containing protein n=1 Tax=Pavo cristatus TaxID=9049 RepID=A0A8C9G846_PAVCR
CLQALAEGGLFSLLLKKERPGTRACGGFLSGEGTIHSPYYPRMSSQPKTCEWIISQPASKVVILNFIDFDIRNTTSCDSDYVEVKNITQSPLLGKYCGTAVPSRCLVVELIYLFNLFKISSVCGESLTGSEGTITSPGFPDVYPHGINCTWTINIQPGYLIRLTFTSFNLPFDDSCRMDYLEIYDNSTMYCGRSIPPSLTSGGNVMMLYFVTDHSISSEGFSANYISLDASKVCGESLTGSEGTITSPGFPDVYPHGINCTWTINIQPGYLIRLTFTSFNLPFDDSCRMDYLEIYDNSTMQKLGRYCGRSIPPSLTSGGNVMMLYFVTDHSISSEGFSANYISLDYFLNLLCPLQAECA